MTRNPSQPPWQKGSTDDAPWQQAGADQAGAAVVCLSGGLDSTSLLLHLLARGVQAFGLSFNYGQKHLIELECLQRNLQYLKSNGLDVVHQVIDLSSLGGLFHSALLNPDWDVPSGHYEEESMRETVVPNRNAIFSSIAYGYAWSVAQRHQSPALLGLGVHSGDHAVYPDCRAEFYAALWKAFEVGNWDADKVTLYLPYLEMDKAQILRDAEASIIHLGLDFDTVFANTLTSYLPDKQGRSHGLTGSDVERILAFHEIGRTDPISYQQPWDELVARSRDLQARFQSRSQNS